MCKLHVEENLITVEKETDVVIATIMRPQGGTGVQTHFNACIEFARRMGVGIELLTPFEANKALVYPVFGFRKLIKRFNLELGVWWYRHWHYAFLRYLAFRRLRSRSRRVVIYAQDPLSAMAALDLKDKGWPVEVVLMVHFNISQAIEWADKGEIRVGGWLYRRILQLESRVLPEVDRLLFPSRFTQQQTMSRIPETARVPNWVIPNFVVAPDGAHEMGNVASGDVITIGTLEPKKNQEFILRVLAHAHRLGHRYRLTVVGDGPLRKKLETLASRLGLEGYVEFTGYLPKAARLLSRHKAYVHASITESFGITLLEAMACGRPVFAAPMGGIPETFTDGIEGFYWDLGNHHVAAEQLVKVLEDKALYEQMSRAARARYETHYSLEEIGPKLLAAVLGSDERRGCC